MLLNLIRLWLGPLPKEEIFPSPKPNPINHWFFHPIKRRLARYYLWLLQNLFGLKVIAITGSVGKTTTKDMLASILASQGPTVATTANITPTYNIPTTILHCTPFTKYLILEMGIEYIGDMHFYTWLARPDIAIITAVNLTHTLHFGDLKTVAYEKGLIGKSAKYLLIPDSDPNIEINTSGQVIKVKTEDFKLPDNLIGDHFKLNASLAIAAAKILGIPTTHNSQLETFNPPPHRMNLIKLKNGSYLIDDTYNANPLATKEALKALVETANKLKKTPVFVFGQMNELGKYEEFAHTEIGLEIRKLGIRNLFCLGPATIHTIKSAGHGKYFDDQKGLYEGLKYIIRDTKYVILIKASRGWHLEDLVKKLVQGS